MGKYIDKIVTASISEAEHALRDTPRTFTYPKTLHKVSEIKKRGREIASHTQYHHHTARCRKLPGGKDKCDLGRPCVQSNSTEFDQIVLEEPKTNCGEEIQLKDWNAVKVEHIKQPPSLKPTDKSKPLPDQDDRVIAITLKRSAAKDKAMTEFIEILTGCLQCNTCTTPVGCGQDAKAAVFYNTSYCTKNPCKLTECLPLLQIARRNAQKYPSGAINSESDIDVAKYTLSKMLNQTTKLCEYSLEQCAAGLLNIKSSYKTSTTTYVYVRKAMTKLQEVFLNNNEISDDSDNSETEEDEEEQEIEPNLSTESCTNTTSFLDMLKKNLSESHNDDDDGELHDIGQVLYSAVDSDKHSDSVDLSDQATGGKIDIVQDDSGSVKFVHQHDDYFYRPISLYFLDYLEFFCIFERISKNKNKDEKKSRRLCNLTMDFQEDHPMFETKCLKLRSLHFTPILAGQPRPSWSSFNSKKSRKQFILYYATLLIPWGNKFEEYALPSKLENFGPAEEFLSVKKFCDLMHRWSGKQGSVPALLRSRYYTFYNIVYNMNAPYKGRLASIKWRVRGADKWCDMNQKDLPPQYVNSEQTYDNSARYNPEAIQAADAAIEQLEQLYSETSNRKKNEYLEKRDKYMSHLGNVFANTYDKEVFLDKEERKNTDFGGCNKVPHGDWRDFDKNWMR